MDFISLKEASEKCSYSQDYLSLRARQGKLKAAKFGRNWVTSDEWLKEYIGQPAEEEPSDTEMKTLVLKSNHGSSPYTERAVTIYAPPNLPVFDEEAEALEDDYHEDIARQKAFVSKLEIASALAAFLVLFGMGILLWGSDIVINGAYFAWLAKLISPGF
jgi:hypothetical protein